MPSATSGARFVRIPYAVADAVPSMSRAALAVYVALARHVDWKQRTCRASYASIAKWAGVNRKTIPGALRELAEAGFISWDTGGKGRSNLYRLPVEPDPATGSTQLLGQPTKRAYLDPATGPKVDPATGPHDKNRILYKRGGEQGKEDERQAKLNQFYSQRVKLD